MGRTYRPATGLALLAIACLAGLPCLSGCGPKLPATKPVTGTVLYQGKPVEGATVLFMRGSRNIAEGEMALGKTDANGRFELTTHFGSQTAGKGAVLGQYDVTISKRVPPPGISESKYQAMVEAANKIADAPAGVVPPNMRPPELVEMFPPQYSMVGKSKLKADVTAAGPNDFEFKLE